jgi:hypothetical protein
MLSSAEDLIAAPDIDAVNIASSRYIEQGPTESAPLRKLLEEISDLTSRRAPTTDIKFFLGAPMERAEIAELFYNALINSFVRRKPDATLYAASREPDLYEIYIPKIEFVARSSFGRTA